MGDAEWMYENDLDPLYRKDEDTGELVEWEGGLNPAYRDDEESYSLYDKAYTETPLDKKVFQTFEDAKTWAKENPGRSFIKAPDGNGYIVKCSTLMVAKYNIAGKKHKKYDNIRPLVYEKIKNYLTREDAEASKLSLYAMRITPKVGREILVYVNDNDFVYRKYRRKNVINGPQGDLEPFIGGNYQLKDNSVEVTFAPNFGVLMYFKENEKNYDKCFMCIIKASGFAQEPPTIIKKEKAKKCKTILDFYFEILEKNPNDLIDIRFFTSPCEWYIQNLKR